ATVVLRVCDSPYAIDLPSFPPRRSSDLGGYIAQYVSTFAANIDLNFVFVGCFMDSDIQNIPEINYCGNILTIYEKSDPFNISARSEEHTSELQSRENLVCRLLLEKKKRD